MSIINPSVNEVKKYLEKWDSHENYVMQERSLNKLFLKTYPANNLIEDVLIKVCALNDFYSTNIYSPFIVAKHIVALNIDERLKNEDLKIVNEIAETKISENKSKYFYSFATKYCSHHYPKLYPIYDSYVDKILTHFKETDNFCSFKKGGLRDYPLFRNVLMKFRSFYGLEIFDLKQIDMYLWQAGKEYFPVNYKK